ncbi:MAG: class I SAM-dependent methyltransferase [Rubrivivax sp.]|jgi:ubiquinone/menaquinone biosynthesis C-methylase UbiE|nr:class I SAM-dependent methyltransferase [Rubrivivax sp.]
MGSLFHRRRAPATDEAITGHYRRILSQESMATHDRTGGWLSRYCGSIAEGQGPERYLRAIQNCLQLERHTVQGLKVLELGSGFGLTCTTLALLGADEVHCIDANEQMVDTMRSYLTTMPEPLPVHPQVALAYDLPFDDNSFDLVFSVEALSHFIHPERCLAEAHRVLKPGGRLVIADDNNALNADAVRETQEVWDRFENGPPIDNIHGHRVLVPYVQRRQRIIERAFPQLSPADAEVLASGTCYLTAPEIIDRVQRYLDSGAKPDSFFTKDRCPVEPESGQFIENLIDPLSLTETLEAMGFKARAEAYLGGESRGGLVYAANALLNDWVPQSVLFARSDGFRIRAQKRQ